MNSRKFAVASQPLTVTGWRIGTGLWPKTVTIVTVLAAFVAGNCCELSQVVTFQLRENFHCYCCASLRRSAPPRCISPFAPVWSLVSAYTTHNTQQRVRTLASVPEQSGRGSALFTQPRRIGFLRTSPFGDSRKFAHTEFSEVRRFLGALRCFVPWRTYTPLRQE